MPPEQPGGLPEATYLADHRVHPADQRRDAGHAAADRRPRRSRSARSSAPGAAPAAGAAAGRGAGPAAQAAGGQAAARPRTRTARAAGAGPHRRGRDPQLHARHRRHAAQPAGRRLADAAPRSGREQLQPAEPDHARQRARAAAGLGRADEPRAAPTSRRRWRTTASVFLNNSNGTIQALDGKTGDLIWEQRLGVNPAMRGMSLYDDKLFLALSNAHLVALDAAHRQGGVGRGDARRPRQLQRPAHRQGQGDPGHGRLLAPTSSRSASSAPTTPPPASSCGSSTPWPRTAQPGGDTLGRAVQPLSRRRRDLDHRQLRPRPEPHLLGHGAGQAVDAGEPRDVRRSTRRSTPAPPWRSTPTPASWRGTSSTRPARRSISTSCSSACSWTAAARTWCSPSARTASCGSWIARPASTSATRRRVFQNVWEIDRRQDRRARATARTSSTPRSASGSTAARAPRAATTGRR